MLTAGSETAPDGSTAAVAVEKQIKSAPKPPPHRSRAVVSLIELLAI
jgi:hypothetical protein